MKTFAQFIVEASPLPKVGVDINNNPVVPHSDQYADYFSQLHPKDIQSHLRDAKRKYSTVYQNAISTENDKQLNKNPNTIKAALHAKAAHKALSLEIRHGQKALNAHIAKAKKLNVLKAKKRDARHKSLHKTIGSVTTALTGGSPIIGHVINSISNHFLNKRDSND